MDNKKIKNAKVIEINGIQFKSKLEASFYKDLLQEGFDVSYEPFTAVLLDGFYPTVPFYKSNTKKEFTIDSKKIRPITYTPDFVINKGDYIYFIEVKGFSNDVYPIKEKLFRKYLESLDSNVKFFLVKTKRQLLEVINIIKQDG